MTRFSAAAAHLPDEAWLRENDPARSRETEICNEGVFARSRETRIVPLLGVDDGALADPLKNNYCRKRVARVLSSVTALHSRDEMAADISVQARSLLWPCTVCREVWGP